MQLIANSGIQFVRTKLRVDTGVQSLMKTIGFHEHRERIDDNNVWTSLEYAIYLPEEDKWANRNSLIINGYLDTDTGVISNNINFNYVKLLTLGENCYSINNISPVIKLYENKWLPVPYFLSYINTILFGPVNWSRMMIKSVPSAERRIEEYEIVIAFDTKTVDVKDDKSPVITQGIVDSYNLCGDLDHLLNFFSEDFECIHNDDYLAELLYGSKSNIPKEFGSTKYLGSFIYLIKYLAASGVMPEIQLVDNRSNLVDVDMVIDVGNSNTCALLFEIASDNFKFDKVKMLQLTDLSNPFVKYDTSFSSNIAFSEANFGSIGSKDDLKFIWPSLLRVGIEASNIINESSLIANRGVETLTHNSSPKRYLWDDDYSKVQWEFNSSGKEPNRIWIDGISHQFNSKGEFVKNTNFSATCFYSRKSLMTFFFVELFAHAVTQINSYEFREFHGNEVRPRRLRKIVVTCPTSMIQQEQIALRQAAEEAALAIKRFFRNNYEQELDFNILGGGMEIIPSVKDCKKDLTNIETRTDWMYDEATCCQLVYIYGEIGQRYKSDAGRFFKHYGKLRKIDGNDQCPTLMVGSLDIGGGTTDIMICSYTYDGKGKAVVTPRPIFYDSFHLAGDDFLYLLINEIILSGASETKEENGCSGVLKKKLIENGFTEEQAKASINNFFGTNANALGYKRRQLRKKFNVEVLIPIALKYLENAVADPEDRVWENQYIGFTQLFPNRQPNKEALDEFQLNFGFRFEELVFRVNVEKVNRLLTSRFDELTRQISSIFNHYGCDLILLAGKLTSIKKFVELIMERYPVSPDRIISLNEYRVGRWYPFSDGNGYFKDKKSIVSVGAMVALMAGRLDNISNFRINTELLKKVSSTANYIGRFNTITKSISFDFSPIFNNYKLNEPGFPIALGATLIGHNNYPAKVIYEIRLNKELIKYDLIKSNPELEHSEDKLNDALALKISNLNNRMPFDVVISRDFTVNKESLKIDQITDREGNQIGNNMLLLKVKTIPNEYYYWLDNGEFI